MKKEYLFTPGPTPIPPNVLTRMAEPIMHHRSATFKPVFERCLEGLKWICQTQNPVLILAASGTGAMEASVTNFLTPGDKTLVINGGKFGERWEKLNKAYGMNTTVIKVNWGEAVDPNEVKAVLDKDPDIKAVYVQASETSTGAYHDIGQIGSFIKNRPNTFFVVDAITALGVNDIKTDEMGIDILVSGSQKALMLPPGLAFIAISDKAWKFNETAKCPRFYFDLAKERKNIGSFETAYTPAISLIVGLDEVFKMLREEGLENLFKRHERLCNATRAAATALGLDLLAKTSWSQAVTAVLSPAGINGQDIVKIMKNKYGVYLAGGQDHLKGKIFRLAHIGYFTELDILTAICCLELVLAELGYQFQKGIGVGAAETVFLEK